MANDRQNPDPIEMMLAELRDVERANVLASTPVDPQALIADVQPAVSLGRMRKVAGWLSAAAVVALSVGLWSLMPQDQGTPNGSLGGSSAGADGGPCDGSFVRCFSGPELVVASRCLTHDYDADGDIDLIDYRDYQIRCNRPPSATR
jgi:hypothetical protein